MLWNINLIINLYMPIFIYFKTHFWSLTFKSIDFHLSFLHIYVFSSFGILILGTHWVLDPICRGWGFDFSILFHILGWLLLFLKSNMILNFWRYIILRRKCQFPVDNCHHNHLCMKADIRYHSIGWKSRNWTRRGWGMHKLKGVSLEQISKERKIYFKKALQM